MGQKNAVTKRFCSDKIRFADLVNGVYFQGCDIIHPDDLTESSEVYAEPRENDAGEKNRDYLERTRDIKMRHQSGASIRILAIENSVRTHGQPGNLEKSNEIFEREQYE